MTHRERVLAAIRHETPDRVPVDAIAIENTEAVGQLLGIPASSVIEHLDIDGRCIAAWKYTGEQRMRDGKPLTSWGTALSDDYGTGHFYPLASASCPAEVDRYSWPEARLRDFDTVRDFAEKMTGEYALRGPYWDSAPIFCTTCSLMGMEETLCKMLVEPAVFEACAEQVLRFSCDYVERFIEAAGPKLDILYLADDFASQRGLMMDPALWRKMLKPRYEKLFALGKRRNLPIWFHSCGDITSVLPDLIDIGMDVWETVQLHTLPMTPEELKRQYGKHITFFGGVNTQRLPFATPGEVAAEVRRCIDVLGAGGGYICGPDHHIKPDVPAANVVALFETARSYRKTGCTGEVSI